MGLETSNYIPEMVDTNPIGASDPVSQGDSHLQLIKRSVQQNFPNFISTTSAPFPVLLSEPEINVLIDAAIKNIAQTIIGDWLFTGANVHEGLESFENLVEFEDNAGNVVAQTETAANGSLLLLARNSAVLKAGYRNPAQISVAGGGVLAQSMEGQVARYSSPAGAVNVPNLEAGTNIGLIHSGSGNITLQGSGGTTLNWLDGAGAANTGTRTVAVNSIIHMRWSATNLVDVWGNGIS